MQGYRGRKSCNRKRLKRRVASIFRGNLQFIGEYKVIAEVIVDIASSETDKIYDYLCDDTIVQGSRVRAPFGGKIVAGFVMRLKEKSDYPVEKLKRVYPTSDELPALNPECLA